MANRKKLPNKKIFTRKKRTGSRSRRKRQATFLFFALLLTIVVLSSIIIYAVFIFPKFLSINIENDLITSFKPVYHGKFSNLVMIKLTKMPDKETEKEFYSLVKEKYSLNVRFEKIDSSERGGIQKISFYQGDNEYEGIDNIFIFWNDSLDMQDIINKYSLNERIKKEYKKKQKSNNKETLKIIEHENDQYEKLEKESGTSYKYCRFEKSDNISAKSRIAIIIDDVGYDYVSAYDFLTLGFPVTFSVIPELSLSYKFYSLFDKYHYPLILHIPMEPVKGRQYVEKSAITSDMTDQEIKNRIKYYIGKYPHIIGANNHMGSKAIADVRIMSALIKELKDENKIWIDSRTTSYTASGQAAAKYNIKYYERDVFLDNNSDRISIRKSMDELISEARQKGYAVGIGHVQTKELVSVLKEYHDKKESLGIEFVPLNRLEL
jgi:polysaccharide deacetylase 2 family uncharacterized protein YibQ